VACQRSTGASAVALTRQTCPTVSQPPAPSSSVGGDTGSAPSPYIGQTIELAQGKEKHLDIDDAKIVAMAATAPSSGGQAPPLSAAEEIDEDQWTLNRYHKEQPIFRFLFADPEGSVL
jgi:hypothetical protein